MMANNTVFIESLAGCIEKVVKGRWGEGAVISLGDFAGRFSFDKFLATYLENSFTGMAGKAEIAKLIKDDDPILAVVRERGRAFLDVISTPDELLAAANPDDLEGALGDLARLKLRDLEVVANILLKYAVAWSSYALKEDKWEEMGYFGPRGKRLDPPAVVKNNTIAMTSAMITPAMLKTQWNRFFSPAYEAQMEKKNQLLKDNIKDVKDYPDDYEADIIVIGTGPGGGAAAYALSMEAKGKKIVVLERGNLYTSEDFNQLERDMVPALYRTPGFRPTDEFGVVVLQGSLVGGSAVLNHGICYEVPPKVTIDWKEKDGTDEPDISEQLKAGGYYKKVQEMIHYREIKPFALNKNAQVLLRGVKEMNSIGESKEELHGVFEYHSRNTRAKIEPGGEPGENYHELTCTGCGFCPLGCRYDRKQSPLISFIPAAIENGLDKVGGNEVRIFKNAEVSQVSHENGEVAGVRIGNKEIKAKIVISSCGALNSARLLMNSGIGNAQLGKNIALHPSPLVYALFDEDIYADWGVPMAASYIENQFPDKDETFPDGFGYILETIYSHPATAALTMPFATMKERMKDYKKMSSVAIILHDKPVGVIKNPKSPLTCVSYKVDEEDKKKLRHGIKTAARIYLKAGAKEVFTSHEKELVFRSEADLDKVDSCDFEPGDILLASAHPQGGCMMGSKGKSVVDYNGHSHDIKNLYVCDASLYPTSLGVNPQLTTMAMGMKIGEYIAKK